MELRIRANRFKYPRPGRCLAHDEPLLAARVINRSRFHAKACSFAVTRARDFFRCSRAFNEPVMYDTRAMRYRARGHGGASR